MINISLAVLMVLMASNTSINLFSIEEQYPTTHLYELNIEKKRVKKNGERYFLFYTLGIKNNTKTDLKFMLTDIDIRDSRNEWHLSQYDSYAKLTRQYLVIPSNSENKFSLYIVSEEPGLFVLKGVKFAE